MTRIAMFDFFVGVAMAQELNPGEMAVRDSFSPYAKYLPLVIIGLIVYVLYHQRKA